ncbi:MAG: hypothetical protein AAGA48_05955 [Myxococcota bacterium]
MLALIWVVACAPVPVDPTGKPFDAVATEASRPVTPTALGSLAPKPGPIGLTQLPPIPEPPTAEELAEANLPPVSVAPSPDPLPSPEPTLAAPAAISPTAVDLNWDPAMPTRGEAFGVTLVGTMVDASPPNAVLRLPNGDKALVEAGEMLDDAGLLVLAVGDKVVKIVKVTKEGWYASVETATLHSNPRGTNPVRPVVPAKPKPSAPKPSLPKPAGP